MRNVPQKGVRGVTTPAILLAAATGAGRPPGPATLAASRFGAVRVMGLPPEQAGGHDPCDITAA